VGTFQGLNTGLVLGSDVGLLVRLCVEFMVGVYFGVSVELSLVYGDGFEVERRVGKFVAA